PIARADLALARGRAFGVPPLAFRLVEAGAQHLHGLRLVLVLRLLVLLTDDDPGGNVGDADRAVRRVDRLPAGAARAEDVDAQILLVDVDVDLLRLGQNGDRRSGSMDPTRPLGLRYPLDAVDARFELEPLEDVAAGDGRARLLDAAELGLGDVERLPAPAAERGIALIHAEELRGEERRLV